MKLAVKPVPNFLLPESPCCYQEKLYRTGQQIPMHFKIEIIVFWKLFMLFQFCDIDIDIVAASRNGKPVEAVPMNICQCNTYRKDLS